MREDDPPSRASSSSAKSDTDSSEDRNQQSQAQALDLNIERTATSSSSVLEQRAYFVISRIRSREPGQTARFTHPLSHSKTRDDVIVDFDGPDDPYRPLNWGFRKKAITTVLYGLTTMGMSICHPDLSPRRLMEIRQLKVGDS